jgi:hypothetical protein
MLMNHYDGNDWRVCHAELAAGFGELFEEEQEEYGDLPAETERIMTSYLQHWHGVDDKLHVVDSELDETVTLPNGDKFRFIIDLVVEEPDGGLWIWDHKTVKNFMPETFMLLDTQLARYFWAAEKLGYKPLRGAMFNEVITVPPTLPKVLKSGGLEQRRNIKCDVYSYYREILNQGLDPKKYKPFLEMLKLRSDTWFRRTRLPRDPALVKQLMRELMMTTHEIKQAEALNHFPRSPMKECQWMCSYLDPCSIQLMGGDISEVVRMKFNSRNTYEED